MEDIEVIAKELIVEAAREGGEEWTIDEVVILGIVRIDEGYRIAGTRNTIPSNIYQVDYVPSTEEK